MCEMMIVRLEEENPEAEIVHPITYGLITSELYNIYNSPHVIPYRVLYMQEIETMQITDDTIPLMRILITAPHPITNADIARAFALCLQEIDR